MYASDHYPFIASSAQSVSPLDSPLSFNTPTPSGTEVWATVVAEATAYTIAHAPTSIPPTSTPLPDGTTCYVNRIAHFTLKLLPGWHTERIWDREYNIPFYNYDSESFGSEEPLPPELAKVDISVYPLAAGKSFEQWLSERRAMEAASIPITLTLSEPYSYTLGKYHGVAYTYTATGYSYEGLIIKLTNGRKVVDIALPAKSLALDEALSMLSTLDISGKETCE